MPSSETFKSILTGVLALTAVVLAVLLYTSSDDNDDAPLLHSSAVAENVKTVDCDGPVVVAEYHTYNQILNWEAFCKPNTVESVLRDEYNFMEGRKLDRRLSIHVSSCPGPIEARRESEEAPWTLTCDGDKMETVKARF